MDKVDRALELRVIDWLQWGEFPNDGNYPALALELIAKRKQENTLLREALEKACYRHHINCDKECVDYCPVKIKRDVFNETGSQPEEKK